MTDSNESIPGTAVVIYRQISWCSVNAAEILHVMEYESGRQRTEHHRTHPGCIHGMVSLVLLLISVVSGASPHLTWAAVYECLDAGGKPLLTNQPAELHNCRMLSEGTDSKQKPEQEPPEVSTPPQVSLPPSIHDRPFPPSHVPSIPPNLPPPCAPGLNILSPLSTPPCVRSDQSGAQPPEAAPTPSP